jgi:hypothetical protein
MNIRVEAGVDVTQFILVIIAVALIVLIAVIKKLFDVLIQLI